MKWTIWKKKPMEYDWKLMTITKTEKSSTVDLDYKVQYVCVYFVYKLLWVYVHNHSVTETQDCDFFNFFTNPKHRCCPCCSCVCEPLNCGRRVSNHCSPWSNTILGGTPVMSCSCQLMIWYEIDWVILKWSTAAAILKTHALYWWLKEKSPLKNS